jgi:putative hemolysin
MNQGQEQKFIDIDKIFKEKSAKAYNYTPGFVLSYLKRIAHQERLNRFQNKANHLKELDYLDACLEEVKLKITYQGLENVPDTGGAIIASNHPLGGLDGLALMQTVAKKRKDVRFLVNDLLMNLKNFGKLFVPVNKLGQNSIEYRNKIEETFGSNDVVLIFPAGLVSRKIDGKIVDLEWNKGFITKAIQYQKPIIPCYITGRLSNFFYRLAKTRKFLGIKANIEMMYLANEMFKQEGAELKIHFAKPIPSSTFNNSKNPKEWAAMVRGYLYAFANNSSLSFNDYLKQ